MRVERVEVRFFRLCLYRLLMGLPTLFRVCLWVVGGVEGFLCCGCVWTRLKSFRRLRTLVDPCLSTQPCLVSESE